MAHSGPGAPEGRTGPVGVPSSDQAPGGASEVVRVRLDLAYDGTDFAGWARQPGLRTVEGTLEEAVGRIWRDEVRLTVAGRTDAGVHARGQVCHVDIGRAAYDRTSDTLVRRLAGLLPPDVRVHAVAAAPPGFDARFAAVSRTYAYRIRDDPARADPLERRSVLSVPQPLDLAAMQAAGELLLGEHDFAAYCRRREGATTVRRLLDMAWHRDADGRAVATVQADAFCHSMVRALVGALLAVGRGRRAPDWPALVLRRGVRDSAVAVAPAHGLVLEHVEYPPDAELAARVRVARQVRAALPQSSSGVLDRGGEVGSF